MDDALVVRGFQRVGDLTRDRNCVIEGNRAARNPLRLQISGTTVEIALREDETRVLELVTELSRRAQVLRVEIGGASLEDVFVQLMSGAGKEGES